MKLRSLLLTCLLLVPPGIALGAARGGSLKTFDAVWTIVNEQHFDPNLNDVDWDAVKVELRPRAAEAADEAELREVIRDMLGRLGQSHFALIGKEDLDTGAQGSKGSPAGTCGFGLRIRNGRAIVTRIDPGGPAGRAGVRLGWVLLGIDGSEWKEIVLGAKAHSVLREETLHWKILMTQVDGEIGSTAAFEFKDGDDRKRIVELERVTRDATAFNLTGLPTFFLEVHSEVVEHDGRRFGILRFSNWFDPIQGAIDEALLEMRDCDGIVIDLRGNTGGDGAMAPRVGGHFFAARDTLGTMKMRHGDREATFRPRRNIRGRKVEPYRGPVAILVDETTGSCSEVFTGGMQANRRARVIGLRTAGAALPSTMSALPNGDSLLHAIADFRTSQGVSLEGQGVVPDTEVDLDRAALLQGRDLMMEAAISWASRVRDV